LKPPLVYSFSPSAAAAIGWTKIILAALIQAGLLILVIVWAKLRRTARKDKKDDVIDLRFRSHFPVVLLGLICGRLALSVALLEIAIICPDQSLPEGHGQPTCSSTRK
jgi:hypothetical protein